MPYWPQKMVKKYSSQIGQSLSEKMDLWLQNNKANIKVALTRTAKLADDFLTELSVVGIAVVEDLSIGIEAVLWGFIVE